MKMKQKLHFITEMIIATAVLTNLLSIAEVHAQFTTQKGGNGPSSSRVLILQEAGEPSSRSYARLTSSFPDIRTFTICYRMQMYRFREETTLLSYALDSEDDEFRIGHHIDEINIAIHGLVVTSSISTPIRYWTHFCLTIDADSGEWSLYQDGKLSDQGQYPEPLKAIKGGGIFVIGQEQDVVGGGFQKDQSYSGEVTEINIWKFILNSDSIARLSNCDIYEEGDALSWSRLSWQLYGEVSWAGRSRDILCAPTSRRVTFFPDRFTLPNAINLCQSVGGNLTVPVSLAENTWLYEGTVSRAPFCSGGVGSAYMWLGAHDNIKEGDWVYIANGLPLAWEGPWRGGTPNGGNTENCLVMLYGDFPSRWSDVSCVDSYSFCVPCEFSRRSTLYLRGPGVCKTSPFNRQYILQGESGGKPALSGYFHSEIVYDSKASSWIMKSLKVAGAIARWTPIRSGEYPFGKRPWTLGYDVCGLRNGDVVNMTLSVCGDGQFTCADGTCIDLSLRCDLREDCPDFSDEMKCSLVEIPTGYQKSIPPPSPRSNRALPVKFSINIMSFSSIVTQDQTYGISFEVRLNWRDRRLNFLNLKEDRILNLLSPETINEIWTPKVFFKNAHDQIVAHAREDSMIECIREGSPIIGAPELPEEVSIYSGGENSLEMRQIYTPRYSCNFNLEMFPFDIQVCSLHFTLISASSSFVTLQEGKAQYSGKTDLMEYIVGKVSLTGGKEDQFSTMKVDVRLSRKYSFYMLTVFFPTSFIVIIAYGTFFFKFTTFQAKILVSLSSLLILSSMFIQMSASVPKTSYSKMLDIWFFVCIVLNFTIVLCHILVEYFTYVSNPSAYNKNGMANGIMRVQPQRPLSVKNGLVGTDPEPLNQYPNLGQNSYPQVNHNDLGPGGNRRPGVLPNHMLLMMGGRISLPVTFIIFVIAFWGSAMKDQGTT